VEGVAERRMEKNRHRGGVTSADPGDYLLQEKIQLSIARGGEKTHNFKSIRDGDLSGGGRINVVRGQRKDTQ